MKLYETVLIARQDISQSQVEEIIKNLKTLITKSKGKILKEEYWGLKTLAYRIKKNRKGHYVLLNIEVDNSTLIEFERIMRLNEDILRFLTISIKEVDDNPSIMYQNRTEKSAKMQEFSELKNSYKEV
tara:strand:+ start:290 stop:673 length:384 start_codon:yes stop_codon:yes gene_type:complete